MRIGMLLMGGTYPPDIRVHKEATVLAKAGHEVFLLTTNRDGRRATEFVDPISVVRYAPKAGLSSKLSALNTLATWYSPALAGAIGEFVTAHKIEALHVHDLPAVKSAVRVARRSGIPVVFDMHENYPAAVSYWHRSGMAARFQTPARYREYERWAVGAVDSVITVVDESAERVRNLGVKPENVVVFTNVDDTSDVLPADPPQGSFVIAYAGGFGPHRGINSLIAAMPTVLEVRPEASLLLLGSGTQEAELRAQARELGLSDAVEFTGWVDVDEMRERLREASVGAVPHLRNEHTDSTVPHKLFQYMAMGLPVVVSDCAPLARIVSETGAGVVARSGDSADLAAKIIELGEPDVARAAGEAGRRAVAERYNLEVEGRVLEDLYRRLAARV